MRAKRFGQLTALGCALALAGAGCGGDDGSGGTTETATGEAGTAWAPGKDTVIARVRTGGGFVPQEVGFSEVSQVVVFGDGRVLLTTPSAGMPNAFVPRTVRTLDDAGLQMVLDQAEEAQLLQTPPEYGQPGVTDVPSTAVSLATADDTYTHSAYALGFEDPGLPAAQTAARTRLDGFVKWLEDIDDERGRRRQQVRGLAVAVAGRAGGAGAGRPSKARHRSRGRCGRRPLPGGPVPARRGRGRRRRGRGAVRRGHGHALDRPATPTTRSPRAQSTCRTRAARPRRAAGRAARG